MFSFTATSSAFSYTWSTNLDPASAYKFYVRTHLTCTDATPTIELYSDWTEENAFTKPSTPVLYTNVSDTNTITLQVADSSSYEQIRSVAYY